MADSLSLLRDLARQLRVHARMDLLLLLSSKSQALVWMVTDLLAYAGGVLAVLLLAERFDGIAGWSEAQLLFLVGYSMSVSGIKNLFFNYNVAAVSRRIGRGQLDHTLLQPRPMLLAFLTEGFSPFLSSGVFGPGVAMLVAGAIAADVALSPWFFGALAASLAASATIVMAANFAIGAIAFWAPRGAEEVSTRATSMVHLTDFPLDPAPVALRTALLTIVPAGFVTWFPAGALLGRRDPSAVLVTPFVALVTAGVATLVFRKGLRHYARTGSQRYSSFGHRR